MAKKASKKASSKKAKTAKAKGKSAKRPKSPAKKPSRTKSNNTVFASLSTGAGAKLTGKVGSAAPAAAKANVKRKARRKASPLTCPPGATDIDSTHLSLDQVVDHVAGLIAPRLGSAS